MSTVAELLAEGHRVASDLALGADTDEQLDELQSRFDYWLSECEDKATACKVVISALELDAERYRNVEKQVAERRKRIEANVDRLRERTAQLVLAMTDGGKPSVRTADGGTLTVQTRKSVQVIVLDAQALPDDCVSVVVKPDLAAIKRVWKETGVVEGADCTEVESSSLVVR